MTKNTKEYNHNYYLTKTKPVYSQGVYCELCDEIVKKYCMYKHVDTKKHCSNEMKQFLKDKNIFEQFRALYQPKSEDY